MGVGNVVEYGGYEFVNLTPHKLVIYNKDKEKIMEIEGCEKKDAVRVVAMTDVVAEKIGEVEITEMEYLITRIPEEVDGRYYVVSTKSLIAIKKMYPERRDFLAPNTRRAITDSNGNIIGTIGFQR